MLVLSRHTGESIMIGDDIKVTITSLNDKQVKVGIAAPSTTPIHRQEVYERIQRDKIAGNIYLKPQAD